MSSRPYRLSGDNGLVDDSERDDDDPPFYSPAESDLPPRPNPTENRAGASSTSTNHGYPSDKSRTTPKQTASTDSDGLKTTGVVTLYLAGLIPDIGAAFGSPDFDKLQIRPRDFLLFCLSSITQQNPRRL